MIAGGLQRVFCPGYLTAHNKIKMDDKVTRLIIVDDHPLVRDALRLQLDTKPHLTVVGEAGDTETALALAAQSAPDLALIDIGLRGLHNGIDLTVALRARYPDIAVLILSMHGSDDYVTQALRAGARGYLLKNSTISQIIAAIATIVAGGTYYSTEVLDTASPGPKLPVLSRRERQVLVCLVNGDSNKAIAKTLHLSVRTVETYRLALKRKLKATTVTDMIRQAITRGLVQL
jgi:DNA-binding NarL/FixJ family response regulator